MVQHETEQMLEQQEERQHEHKQILAREVKEYLNNNDPSVLKRVLFKSFVHQSVPTAFQKDKTQALMCLMLADTQNVETTIHVRPRHADQH
jgi:hypothetical protein